MCICAFIECAFIHANYVDFRFRISCSTIGIFLEFFIVVGIIYKVGDFVFAQEQVHSYFFSVMGYIMACICGLINLGFVMKKSNDFSFRAFNSLIVLLLELSVMVGTAIKIFPFLRESKIRVPSSINSNIWLSKWS